MIVTNQVIEILTKKGQRGRVGGCAWQFPMIKKKVSERGQGDHFKGGLWVPASTMNANNFHFAKLGETYLLKYNALKKLWL